MLSKCPWSRWRRICALISIFLGGVCLHVSLCRTIFLFLSPAPRVLLSLPRPPPACKESPVRRTGFRKCCYVKSLRTRAPEPRQDRTSSPHRGWAGRADGKGPALAEVTHLCLSSRAAAGSAGPWSPGRPSPGGLQNGLVPPR